MITNPKYQSEIDRDKVIQDLLDFGALAYWVNTNGTVTTQLKNGTAYDLGEFTIEVVDANGGSYHAVFTPESYKVVDGVKQKELSKILKIIGSKDISPEFDPNTNTLKFRVNVECTFQWNDDFPKGFEDTRFSTNLA